MTDRQSQAWPVFPSTHWTEVSEAVGFRGLETQQEALGFLLTKYLPALRGFLVTALRMEPHQAEDLAQSFVEKKVLQEDFLRRASQERGRFRSFLLTSFRNFARDERIRDSRLKRAPPLGHVSLEELAECESLAAMDEAFCSGDVSWARMVLVEAVRRMSAECEARGRHDLWRIFERRLWRPYLDDVPETSWEALAQELGFDTFGSDFSKLYNLQITAKRAFRAALKSVVAEYAKGEVEAEIHELIETLLHVPLRADLPPESKIAPPPP
jgi:hypothetical protein